MATQKAGHYVDLIVGVVIIAAVVAGLTTTLVTQLTNLSATFSAQGLPFASLLSPGGVTGILFAIGVFYALYRILWGGASGSRRM